MIIKIMLTTTIRYLFSDITPFKTLNSLMPYDRVSSMALFPRYWIPTIKESIYSDKDNQQERDNRIKKNVNRNFKYYKYAPLETTCNVVYNIGRSIKDIEE